MMDVHAETNPHTELFAERVQLMGTEAAFGFGSRITEVEQADGQRVIRCNLGQPDFPLPTHIAEAVIDAIRSGQTTYCDPQGMPELRASLARKIAARHSIDLATIPGTGPGGRVVLRCRGRGLRSGFLGLPATA